jgi:ribose-phosphate pyrophosphokinase
LIGPFAGRRPQLLCHDLATVGLAPPIAQDDRGQGDGNVAGRTALVVDIMVDTAGTLTKVVDALKAAGALEVLASCSHAVLSGHAIERSRRACLLIVTDLIRLRRKARERAIVVLSISGLLGRAIKNIHEETSVTSLFV